MYGPTTFKIVENRYFDGRGRPCLIGDIKEAVLQGKMLLITDEFDNDVTHFVLCRIAFKGCMTASPEKHPNIYTILEQYIDLDTVIDCIENGGFYYERTGTR